MNDDHSAAATAPAGVLGLFALELSDDTAPQYAALPQQAAGRLAALLGRDLGALVPEARTLDLVVAAAHFDPAEALRPGWPLHRRLDELHARAPRDGAAARIVAFGADSAGAVPLPLQSDPQLAGGRLRVLPYLFAGDAGTVAAVAARMESVLLDTGMARPDTALLAQDAFGLRIEHARYLTLHDLLAMTAMQYAHQGLEPLWPILETALLAPAGEARLDAPPEPRVHYADGEARIALFSPDAWRRRYADGDEDAARLQRRSLQFEMRQKQFAAVLHAHGVPVLFEQADASLP